MRPVRVVTVEVPNVVGPEDGGVTVASDGGPVESSDVRMLDDGVGR